MKIRELEITNYKSIRNQELTDLDDLVILIGANSSGKTTLLEALQLFFSQFQAIGGKTEGLNQDLWHNRNPRSGPISFSVLFEIEANEAKELLPESEEPTTFQIERRLLRPSGEWSTKTIKLGELALVEDDKLVAPLEKSAMITVDNIRKLVKERFTLIPSVRGVFTPGLLRTPEIPASILERVKAIGTSEETNHMETFSKFKADLPGSFPGELRAWPAYLYAEVRAIRIPIGYVGGARNSSALRFSTESLCFSEREKQAKTAIHHNTLAALCR